MTRLTLLGTAAILSMVFAKPVPAQAGTHEPGACPTASQAPTGVGAPAPSAGWLSPGCETSTRPWSAPVGHRQPQAVDVPVSTSSFEQAPDEENARLNRVINGICRGC